MLVLFDFNVINNMLAFSIIIINVFIAYDYQNQFGLFILLKD